MTEEWPNKTQVSEMRKTPLVNPLTREVCMMHFSTTDCSLFFAKMSKFMTKYTLIGLLAVCATVLCFH